MKRDLVPIVIVLILALGCPAAGAGAAPPGEPSPPESGGVVCLSGPVRSAIGADVLDEGGSAADAALSVALHQVARCGGSYVSTRASLR